MGRVSCISAGSRPARAKSLGISILGLPALFPWAKNTNHGYSDADGKKSAARNPDLGGRGGLGDLHPWPPTSLPPASLSHHSLISMQFRLWRELMGPSTEVRQEGRPTSSYRESTKGMFALSKVLNPSCWEFGPPPANVSRYAHNKEMVCISLILVYVPFSFSPPTASQPWFLYYIIFWIK